jgi:hypothetical protein
MQRKRFYALLASALAAVAAPAGAQTVAPGPYYAMPAWDQTLACTSVSSCPRFVVLSNMASAAVLDRETGLVWERQPSAELRGYAASRTRCNEDVTLGNRLGWRIPTLQELVSLIDTSRSDPALPPGHPFVNVSLSSYYWTATDDRRNSDFAWRVAFFGDGDSGNGLSGDRTDPNVNLLVWCVRGGAGSDSQ